MFIDLKQVPPLQLSSEKRKGSSEAKVLVEFRSSELSWNVVDALGL